MKKKHIKSTDKKEGKKVSNEHKTKKHVEHKKKCPLRNMSKEIIYTISAVVVVLFLVLIAILMSNNHSNTNKLDTVVLSSKNDSNLNSNSMNQKDYVMAIVNGKNLNFSEFSKQSDLILFFQGVPDSYKSQIPQLQLLNQTIQENLMYEKAVKSNFMVTPAEARTNLESVLSRANRNLDDFKKTLENKSFSYDDLISYYAKKLTISNFLNQTIESKIVVSDDDVLNYYNQNKASFVQGEKIRASHILVNSSELAVEIISKLNNGANFSDLAKNYSTGPSGANGGDLGFFSKGQMVPAFETAAFGLKNISDYTHTPVKTQFGYHIIELTGIQPAQNLSFDEVKTDLKTKLIKDKRLETLKVYITNLENSADIKLMK